MWAAWRLLCRRHHLLCLQHRLLLHCSLRCCRNHLPELWGWHLFSKWGSHLPQLHCRLLLCWNVRQDPLHSWHLLHCLGGHCCWNLQQPMRCWKLLPLWLICLYSLCCWHLLHCFCRDSSGNVCQLCSWLLPAGFGSNQLLPVHCWLIFIFDRIHCLFTVSGRSILTIKRNKKL